MELGYTPANLKIIRAQYCLTKKQVAAITGTSNPDAIYRWESDIDAKHHADMPHAKWCKLLAHLDINPHKENYMKVKLIDTGNPKVRRLVSGKLVDILNLDYTKPLDKLRDDVLAALKELEQRQSFIKNMLMFGFKDVRVAFGGSHLQIVDNGKPEGLGWLFIGDHFIADADETQD